MYLAAQLEEMFAAVRADDPDRVAALLDHIRAEAGDVAAEALIAQVVAAALDRAPGDGQ
jgi:hypothetical protein